METNGTEIKYEVHHIPLSKLLSDNDFNCRGEISPLSVIDLAKSIEKDGLLQPIIVRPLKKKERENYKDEGYEYSIIAGFCRHMAHIVLKRDTIPCIIRTDLDEKTSRILNLTENLGRSNLDILQEARAILPLLKLGMNEYQIASSLPNVSRGWVQVRRMLLRLPEAVQKEAAIGAINQADIRSLITLKINGGTEEDIYDAVKTMKDSKRAKQTKQPQPKRKIPPEKAQKVRLRPDLIKMIDYILEHVDVKQKNVSPEFGTRCLAWAAGNISDLDIYMDIRDVCEIQNLEYTVPSESI